MLGDLDTATSVICLIKEEVVFLCRAHQPHRRSTSGMESQTLLPVQFVTHYQFTHFTANMISPRAWSALLILACQVSGQQEPERVNTCIRQVTCRECLTTPTCMWCDDPKLGEAGKGPPIRCQSSTSAVPADWCSEEHVVNPRPESYVLEDNPLKGAKEALSPDGVVQIRPQFVKLRLRVGETLELPIQYRQAEDYPVDLYYLMDLSASMDDDKKNLSSLGDKLAAAMQSITGNFRLGFGSFVDKVVMPFTSTVPSRRIKVVQRESSSIKVAQRKSSSIKVAQRKSSSIKVAQRESSHIKVARRESSSIKVAQRMSSSIKVAQRKSSSIKVAQRESSHIKVAQRESSSIKSEVQKAPVSGNLDAPEGGFDAIMQAMVCHQQIGWRPKARHLLVFSTDADFHMAGDGRKLVDSVVLGDDSGDSVEVRYFSKCLNKSGDLHETRECGGISVREQVDFIARIKETVRTTFSESAGCQLDHTGLAYNQFNLPNASECRHRGDLQCGVCQCHDPFMGQTCECEGEFESGNSTTGCLDKDGRECSGFGTCHCNTCNCNIRPDPKELIFGTLCECDNFSCKRSNDLVCSGPEHGHCNCGRCVCQPGWTGPSCNCKDTNIGCTPPGGLPVCNGRGTCECGACNCTATTPEGHLYRGRYCDDCSTCEGKRCTELKDCVECQVHKINDLAKCSNCSFSVKPVDDITDDGYDSEEDTLCRGKDDGDCSFQFRYRYAEKVLTVWGQRKKECGANVWAVVFGLIGATVLIGLLFIIVWKVLTTIHDQREYAKFEKERAQSRWDRGDNPLYKPSTSTFSNPTFGKE
uniref:Integrin beta n=1 Tax=Timema tahoe TaxID=61484 RepID=A0A7R9FGJ9_9NEOP|nr:unnamed protein product [Timema tahoe]